MGDGGGEVIRRNAELLGALMDVAEDGPIGPELPSHEEARVLRLSRGVTQTLVARAVGVTDKTLILWEQGHTPQLLNAVRYRRVLNFLRGLPSVAVA
jgi:DNA-binding XRE family transcriptional regulator